MGAGSTSTQSVESISPCQAPNFSMSTFQPPLMVQKSKKTNHLGCKKKRVNHGMNQLPFPQVVSESQISGCHQAAWIPWHHGPFEIFLRSKPWKPSWKKMATNTLTFWRFEVVVTRGWGPTLGWLGMRQVGRVFTLTCFCGVVFACNVHPKGSRTHMVVKLVRAHTLRESVVKPVNSRVIIGPREKCMTQDLQIFVCDLVGRKGWKAVSQMAVFE